MFTNAIYKNTRTLTACARGNFTHPNSFLREFTTIKIREFNSLNTFLNCNQKPAQIPDSWVSDSVTRTIFYILIWLRIDNRHGSGYIKNLKLIWSILTLELPLKLKVTHFFFCQIFKILIGWIRVFHQAIQVGLVKF